MPMGHYVDAMRNNWRLRTNQASTVLQSFASNVDSHRVSMFNSRLMEEYDSGNVNEALSLFKLDWSNDTQREMLKSHPYAILSGLSFTTIEYEPSTTKSPENEYPLSVKSILAVAAPRTIHSGDDAESGSKRKRRRKEPPEDGSTYVLVYLGTRKPDFYKRFENHGMIPGLNAYAMHSKSLAPVSPKRQSSHSKSPSDFSLNKSQDTLMTEFTI